MTRLPFTEYERLPSHKVRYTFQGDFGSCKVKPDFVLVLSEPNLQDMTLVTKFVEPTGNVDTYKWLYRLLADFYDFGAHVFRRFETDSIPNLLYEIKTRLGNCVLHKYDGVGEITKTWTLLGVWPHSVNFGDLCYSSDPTLELEVTWRFQECHEG